MVGNNVRFDKDKDFRRVLLIGLGGVGTSVVRRAGRWIRELWAKKNDKKYLPPFIKILAFDTDTQENFSGDVHRLLPNVQYVNLGGFSATRLLSKKREVDRKYKNGERLDYLNPFVDRDLNPGIIRNGAHGIPLIGRLCYVYHHGSRILAPLNTAIRELLDPMLPIKAQAEDLKMEMQQDTIAVHIISSVCGGTGAGILMDMALDVRRAVRKYSVLDPEITGHFIMPNHFGKEHNDDPLISSQLERNAYYLLSQIDFLMSKRDDDIEVTTKYSSGIRNSLGSLDTLFDSVYLINEVVESKQKTEDIIGRAIVALTLEDAGRMVNTLWDNIQSIKAQKEPIHIYKCYGIQTFQPPSDEEKAARLKQLVSADLIEYLRGLRGRKREIDSKRAMAEFEDLIEEHMGEEPIVTHENIEDFQYDDEIDIPNIRTKAAKIEQRLQKHLLDVFFQNGDVFRLLLELFDWAGEKSIEALKSKCDELQRECNVLKEDVDAVKLNEKKPEFYRTACLLSICERLQSLEAKLELDRLEQELKSIRQEFVKEIKGSPDFVDRSFSDLNIDLSEIRVEIDDRIRESRYPELIRRLAAKKLENSKSGASSATRKADIKAWISELYESKDFKKNRDEMMASLVGKAFKDGDAMQILSESNLNPFINLDESGNSESSEKRTFVQFYGGEEEDFPSRLSFIPCPTKENCDWIVMRSYLGFSLEQVQDFMGKYKDEFVKTLSENQQYKLWRWPLFDFVKESGKLEDDYYLERVFKLEKEDIEKIKKEKS